MSFSHKSLPTRTAPPRAGGGQPSTISDHQSVAQLAPSTYGNLENIYKSLHSRSPESRGTEDGPPLTSFEDFQAWFQSPAAAALAPAIPQDLSFPISNYYISSSHNTYLSGNQLYGSSSTAAYTNVLLRGCRCLEIDVWDGHDEDSSASSSDVEEGKAKTGTEGRRHRASSKLSQLKVKMKDRARRSPSPAWPGTSPDQEGELSKIPTAESYATEPSMRWEPRVYHGYTLVKGIPFRNVCRAIRDSAFIASTLPIIVSLEVHANMDQQKLMVDIMEQEWKGHLIDISDSSLSEIEKLPNPDELREKILIKVKWAPNSQTGESNDPIEHVQSFSSSASKHDGSETSPEQQKKASKVLEALSRLGVYTRAYTFKQFDQPEAKIPTHVFSLEENKLQSIHSDPEHGPALFKHNQDFLMRIFPSGLRVNSSNIDPTFGWRQGAQMVALNWQSLDRGMMLNEGMFSGAEGWVLKPEGFRNTAISQTKPRHEFLNLTIKLISGQSLPPPADKDESHLPHLRPTVTFQLHVDTHGPPGQGKTSASNSTAGLMSKYGRMKTQPTSDGEDEDDDAEARKLKRKSKHGKSANPSYDDDAFVWTDVPDVVEMLSFLRIKVKDDRKLAKDDLIAWACIRLDRLKTGYRFVHLLDVDGRPCEGVLLMRVEKTLH